VGGSIAGSVGCPAGREWHHRAHQDQPRTTYANRVVDYVFALAGVHGIFASYNLVVFSGGLATLHLSLFLFFGRSAFYVDRLSSAGCL